MIKQFVNDLLGTRKILGTLCICLLLDNINIVWPFYDKSYNFIDY